MSRGNLDVIQEKIKKDTDLLKEIARWNLLSKKIVFTNGCFDILHRGHVEYLAQAADQGDILCIGLNSDRSVKKLKGQGRPLQDEYSRATALAALAFVDTVVMFDEETPYNLIHSINPDVLVKGGDYLPENIVGYDIVTRKGGRVITIPLVEGYSTTGIINKLLEK